MPGTRTSTKASKSKLAELEKNHEVRCVILTGDEKGRAFSAGANLADSETHTVASPAAFITGIPQWRKFVANLLTDFPKPVIAAVNGYAIGIGCIATYCCDLIVASERAEWRLPQVRLGIMPAYGGAVRLARWVGKGNAMRAALGQPIDAAEAYRIGLAQWLVPHGELMAQALKVADDIAALPPLAARMVEGIADPRPRHSQHPGRVRGRRLSLHGARPDRGFEGSAQCLAREAHGHRPRRLTWAPSPASASSTSAACWQDRRAASSWPTSAPTSSRSRMSAATRIANGRPWSTARAPITSASTAASAA